jgi:hypothetical protein
MNTTLLENSMHLEVFPVHDLDLEEGTDPKEWHPGNSYSETPPQKGEPILLPHDLEEK